MTSRVRVIGQIERMSDQKQFIQKAHQLGLGAGLAMMLNGCSHGGGHKATHQPAHKDLESQL